jgi:hypothetical protein
MVLSKFIKLFSLSVILCFSTIQSFAWGIWGHNHINKGAIMALPKEMGVFFYNHADFIVEESTVPDLRKYTMNDKAEGPRHYINIEKYNNSFKSLNIPFAEITKSFPEDSINKFGILPWHIQEMMDKLTEAFRKKRKTEILFIAADLGHYIGDAHMPLHTTINHDGQATGQRGIHAFWEAQLPELFGRNYNLRTPNATYVNNISQTVWNFIDSSHALSTKLLSIELSMKKDNPDEKQYILNNDGKPSKNKFGAPIHKYEYAHVYHELLNGMVERQMRNAIAATANLWYTAWVNAGSPNLTDLDNESLTERNKPYYTEDKKAWQNGKVKGCKSEREFPRPEELK